jgi:hypothetical protein
MWFFGVGAREIDDFLRNSTKKSELNLLNSSETYFWFEFHLWSEASCKKQKLRIYRFLLKNHLLQIKLKPFSILISALVSLKKRAKITKKFNVNHSFLFALQFHHQNENRNIESDNASKEAERHVQTLFMARVLKFWDWLQSFIQLVETFVCRLNKPKTPSNFNCSLMFALWFVFKL